MAKKEVNKYPLNMRGMGIEVTKDVTALRKSMALLEKEAHENGLEIAAIDGKLNALLERDHNVDYPDYEKQIKDLRRDFSSEILKLDRAVMQDAKDIALGLDSINTRINEIDNAIGLANKRNTIALVLSGVAIGMTILFTTILLGTMYNVNNSVDSGKQITIMFP